MNVRGRYGRRSGRAGRVVKVWRCGMWLALLARRWLVEIVVGVPPDACKITVQREIRLCNGWSSW